MAIVLNGTTGLDLPALDTDALTIGGSSGTAGQVLTSGGSGAAPSWTTISSSSFTLLATVGSQTGIWNVGVTGLDLTTYKALYVVLKGITPTYADATTIYFSDSNTNGSAVPSVPGIYWANRVGNGSFWVDLISGGTGQGIFQTASTPVLMSQSSTAFYIKSNGSSYVFNLTNMYVYGVK